MNIVKWFFQLLENFVQDLYVGRMMRQRGLDYPESSKAANFYVMSRVVGTYKETLKMIEEFQKTVDKFYDTVKDRAE